MNKFGSAPIVARDFELNCPFCGEPVVIKCDFEGIEHYDKTVPIFNAKNEEQERYARATAEETRQDMLNKAVFNAIRNHKCE